MSKQDALKRKKLKNKPLKVLVIPDMQIKPGIDLRFVYAIGCYIASKKPDVVLNMGDMADLPSLSSYDKGKRSAEGKRYKHDVQATILAQDLLWEPVLQYNALQMKRKDICFNPLRIFLMGNHEDRADRATQLDPSLFGTINIREDLKLTEYWDEVYDFMEAATINGVIFSHYFGTGPMNRPCSSAQQQLNRLHTSCVAGHQPGRQTHTTTTPDGRILTSIIAGSSYDYDLEYMGPQGNNHWRGILLLHNVFEGSFDEVYVPTEYLKNKYTKNLKPLIYRSST